MNLYELNKANYAALPDMTVKQIGESIPALQIWLIEKTRLKPGGRYWMILNHDTHYYTMYVWKSGNSFDLACDVVNLMHELGSFKSIEPTSDKDAYEFWITGEDGETRMYLFFNYDQGVIEV